MKRFIFLITMIFMFNSSMVFAGDKDNYFNLKGMVVDQNDLNPSGDVELDGAVTDKSGFGFAIALGHKFGKNFRVEAQYARRNVSINARDESRNPLTDFEDVFSKEEITDFGLDGTFTGKASLVTEKDIVGVSTQTAKIKGTYIPWKKNKDGSYVMSGRDKVAETDSKKIVKFDESDQVVYANPSVFFNQDELVVQTAMVNGYYDIHLGALSPYVGAGAGIGFLNIEDEANFAWQVMAGVSFAVSDRVSASVGWTRLDAGEVEIRRGSHVIKTNTDSNSVDFGITYSF